MPIYGSAGLNSNFEWELKYSNTLGAGGTLSVNTYSNWGAGLFLAMASNVLTNISTSSAGAGSNGMYPTEHHHATYVNSGAVFYDNSGAAGSSNIYLYKLKKIA